MKKGIKGLIMGFTLTISLSVICTIAMGYTEKIENIQAEIGAVEVVVNEDIVDTPTILWQGTTYVPLRATSEMLGAEVNWDQRAYRATINTGSSKDDLAYEQVARSLSFCNQQMAILSFAAQQVLMYVYCNPIDINVNTLKENILIGLNTAISFETNDAYSSYALTVCRNQKPATAVVLEQIYKDAKAVSTTAKLLFNSYNSWTPQQKQTLFVALDKICTASVDISSRSYDLLRNWKGTN